MSHKDTERKKTPMKLYLAMTALAIGSIALNVHFARESRTLDTMLENCARTENVYTCKLTAVPTVAPKVAYAERELLPPPASSYR